MFQKPRFLLRLMPASGGHAIAQRIPAKICVVLAFLCAAAIVAGFIGLNPSRSSISDTTMAAASKRARIAHLDAQVKEILDRPLFNSDRSPTPEPPSPEELAKLRPPVLKSHLVGITILAEMRLALFAGDGNKYQSLKEGEEIDGFKVRAIAADRVTLASSFGEQIVRPNKGTYETVKNTKPIALGSFDPDKN
jgi:hypothetical protein